MVNVDESMSSVLVTLTPGFMDGSAIVSTLAYGSGNSVILSACPTLLTGYSNQITF